MKLLSVFGPSPPEGAMGSSSAAPKNYQVTISNFIQHIIVQNVNFKATHNHQREQCEFKPNLVNVSKVYVKVSNLQLLSKQSLREGTQFSFNILAVNRANNRRTSFNRPQLKWTISLCTVLSVSLFDCNIFAYYTDRQKTQVVVMVGWLPFK